MSLNIFTVESEIPKNMELITYNDAYFNLYTSIPKSDLSLYILREVEKAKYSSDITFIGRTEEFGSLYKECLSTGTKTLFNIMQHQDKCFDVLECGTNALVMLLYIQGNILWREPFIVYKTLYKEHCDINFKGVHYDRIEDFVDAVNGD